MKTNHEEAAIIIVHHLVIIASGASDDSYIKVVCDDTDVFVLLIHFFLEKEMTMNGSMESPSAGRTIIYIGQTTATGTQAHHQIPACRTRLDWVQYGIISVWHWKAIALKVLMGGHHLMDLGQKGADEDKLISKATTFVAACYGSKIEGDTITYRYHMWRSNILDPIQYGWHAGDDDTTLYPTTLPACISAAAFTILHLIKCGCSTSRP